MTVFEWRDWPHWLGRGALLLIMAVMALATVRTSLALHAREASEAAARMRVQSWHEQIALELPLDQRQDWATMSVGHPELLLRACSLEHAGEE